MKVKVGEGEIFFFFWMDLVGPLTRIKRAKEKKNIEKDAFCANSVFRDPNSLLSGHSQFQRGDGFVFPQTHRKVSATTADDRPSRPIQRPHRNRGEIVFYLRPKTQTFYSVWSFIFFIFRAKPNGLTHERYVPSTILISSCGLYYNRKSRAQHKQGVNEHAIFFSSRLVWPSQAVSWAFFLNKSSGG